MLVYDEKVAKAAFSFLQSSTVGETHTLHPSQSIFDSNIFVLIIVIFVSILCRLKY